MQRVGILTSGGDAPGMNAAIRAAVRTATANGLTVLGYRDGYTGILRGNFEELDDRAVGNQIQRGGTFLGTSRSDEFRRPEGRARAMERLKEDSVEGLVVIGGDGSFRGALALHEEFGLPVTGIPGTIDNDVWGTDHTIGFDTAVNSAVLAIDQVRDTSESTGMMFFVEVMGRTSGAIAMQTALGAGAAGVLVPEARERITELAAQLKISMERGKRSHIIVVAEGDEAGGAFGVGKEVGELLNHPYRVVVLGHVQRGGRPTVRDRIIAAQSGAMAIESLLGGCGAVMIGMKNGYPIEVPLKDVVAHAHPEPRMDILRLAQLLSG